MDNNRINKIKALVTKWELAICILISSVNLSACSSDEKVAQNENITTMKLKITIGDKSIMATMYDNSTTKDFMSMLPLTLNLEDYAGTEKVSSLSRKLITKGAPSGYDPNVGDITYYAPW